MEVTRDQYAIIETQADSLHTLISDLMNAIKPGNGTLTGEWHELHDLLKAVSAIRCTAGRYRDRAELPADPIDFTPTSAAYSARLLAGMPDCAPLPRER